jgi:ABC-type branched-subunit amino acid transport system substrate-binding protein
MLKNITPRSPIKQREQAGKLTRRRRRSARNVTMSEQDTPLSRRRFLAGTAWGAIAATTGSMAAPSVLRAQGAGVKVGVLHPVTGALSYSGQQGRIGAMLAVEEINAAGGIKALAGAKIDAMPGDAQSTPDGGTAEVEKMNAAEVSCIVGGYSSSICLAVSQAAARYDLPYVVDVGVADSIVTRGLKNTFRFGPGFGVIAKTALDNLTTINDGAGKPAKTVMIVHEDSLFGSGLAKLLNAQLPPKGLNPRDHRASDADPRLQQRRAQDQGAEPRPRHTRELLQRICPARAHDAGAAGAAQGHLLGARRRRLLLQVRQGVSRCRQIHHGLQSLVQPEESQGA